LVLAHLSGLLHLGVDLHLELLSGSLADSSLLL
jgi:hypothetical protein